MKRTLLTPFLATSLFLSGNGMMGPGHGMGFGMGLLMAIWIIVVSAIVGAVVGAVYNAFVTPKPS
jgi:hypothetical protein